MRHATAGRRAPPRASPALEPDLLAQQLHALEEKNLQLEQRVESLAGLVAQGPSVPEWQSYVEVAHRLRCSVSKLRKLIRQHAIATARIGPERTMHRGEYTRLVLFVQEQPPTGAERYRRPDF